MRRTSRGTNEATATTGGKNAASIDADPEEAPDSTEKRLRGFHGDRRRGIARPTFVKFGASRCDLRGDLVYDRRVVEDETAEGFRGNFQEL